MINNLSRLWTRTNSGVHAWLLLFSPGSGFLFCPVNMIQYIHKWRMNIWTLTLSMTWSCDICPLHGLTGATWNSWPVYCGWLDSQGHKAYHVLLQFLGCIWRIPKNGTGLINLLAHIQSCNADLKRSSPVFICVFQSSCWSLGMLPSAEYSHGRQLLILLVLLSD